MLIKNLVMMMMSFKLKFVFSNGSKDAAEMAKSEDPDQTAQLRAV